MRQILQELTTGQAAKLTGVSQQTIIRHFNSGALRGRRVPGSKFRRVYPESLYELLVGDQVDTDPELDRRLAAIDVRYRVLVVGKLLARQTEELSRRLSSLEGIRLMFAGAVKAPAVLQQKLAWIPDAVLFFGIAPKIAIQLATVASQTSVMADGQIVYYAPTPIVVDEAAALSGGITTVLNSTTSVKELADKVRLLAALWSDRAVKKSGSGLAADEEQ